MSNNIVEYNNIYNVMKDLNDGGGIYVLGKQPGTIINNNIIKNVNKTENHLSDQYLFGLYFDHAEDTLAKNNLVSNADYSGIIFFKEPKNLRAFSRNNKVENNIFVDSGRYQTYFNSREDTFTKNIVYYNNIKNPQDAQLVYNNAAGIIKSSDYNLFYTPKVVPVYRFWNKKTGNDHFYTTDEAEKDKLIKTYSNVWTPEGAAFYVYEDKAKDTVPVYRFYNNKTGGHFYTTNEAEKQKLIDKYSYVWIPEGIAFYVYPSVKNGLSPVYRFYNPKTEEHFYTINEAEKNKLLSSQYKNTWTPEGIAFYAYANAVSCSLCSMLDAWKKTGQDKNSIIANPMFEDYWNGNFNIKNNSPALKLPINFAPIDFSKVPKD